MTLFLPLWTGWIAIKDGDDHARALFDQHYSRYFYADGRKPKLFVGPGEKMVLTTADRLAIFVWRKFQSADGQLGVNCAVFSNRGPELSSDLIRQADALADARWPGERHFTYVSAKKTASRRSKNGKPGQCFIHAGWRPCGITKRRKLHILERLPEQAPAG